MRREVQNIETEAENDRALARIRELWDSPEGSAEGDEMEMLTQLVEAFERKAYEVR